MKKDKIKALTFINNVQADIIGELEDEISYYKADSLILLESVLELRAELAHIKGTLKSLL